MTSDVGSPGPRALALMDKLLVERPEKIGHDFSETARCLSAFRDEVIAAVRAGSDADRERLDGVNAVLSTVVGGHFPLGPVPWEHIAKARERLAAVVGG